MCNRGFHTIFHLGMKSVDPRGSKRYFQADSRGEAELQNKAKTDGWLRRDNRENLEYKVLSKKPGNDLSQLGQFLRTVHTILQVFPPLCDFIFPLSCIPDSPFPV